MIWFTDEDGFPHFFSQKGDHIQGGHCLEPSQRSKSCPLSRTSRHTLMRSTYLFTKPVENSRSTSRATPASTISNQRVRVRFNNLGLGHFWKFNPDMGYFFRTCVKFTKTQVPLEYLVHSTFQRVKHFFSGFGVLLLL